MSVLSIPAAISSAVSSLTSHHGHKKGVHGGGGSSALNSATSGTDDSEPTGSTQSLFGTLMDSVEQVVGIQTPASTTTANGANLTTLNGVHSATASLNASKLSPAAMITAARAAIQKA
jgi:hypothetical protein